VHGNGNGRECGEDVTRLLDVVEASYAHIFGNADACLAQYGHSPDSGLVVSGEEGSGAIRSRQVAARGLDTTFKGKGARPDEVWIKRHSCRGERLAIPLEPVGRRGQLFRPA